MSWGLTGLLILFALFIIVLILNPKLSCFGRVLKSPFYPLKRKKAKKKKIDDYGFRLH